MLEICISIFSMFVINFVTYAGWWLEGKYVSAFKHKMDNKLYFVLVFVQTRLGFVETINVVGPVKV